MSTFMRAFSRLSVFAAVISIGFGPQAALAGGTIKGKITLEGAAPAPEVVTVPADKKTDCHAGPAKITLNNLLVSEGGGVKNFVVSLTAEGKKGTPKSEIFDQKGCLFLTPVLVVPTGSKVTMKNSDPGSHNIRTSTIFNAAINLTLASGETKDYELKAAEAVKVNCDIHPWMNAAIVAVDTDIYTLTNENGEFEIKDVPAGDYKFKAWHPVLGKAKSKDQAPKTVTIKDGETVEVIIKKKPKKKKKK